MFASSLKQPSLRIAPLKIAALLASCCTCWMASESDSKKEIEISPGSTLTVFLHGDVATVVKDQLLELEFINYMTPRENTFELRGTVVEMTEDSIHLRASAANRMTGDQARLVTLSAVIDRKRIEKITSNDDKRFATSTDQVVRISDISDVEIEIWSRLETIKRQSMMW